MSHRVFIMSNTKATDASLPGFAKKYYLVTTKEGIPIDKQTPLSTYVYDGIGNETIRYTKENLVIINSILGGGVLQFILGEHFQDFRNLIGKQTKIILINPIVNNLIINTFPSDIKLSGSGSVGTNYTVLAGSTGTIIIDYPTDTTVMMDINGLTLAGAGGTNIYNSDGTLLANRDVNCNNLDLSILNNPAFIINEPFHIPTSPDGFIFNVGSGNQSILSKKKVDKITQFTLNEDGFFQSAAMHHYTTPDIHQVIRVDGKQCLISATDISQGGLTQIEVDNNIPNTVTGLNGAINMTGNTCFINTGRVRFDLVPTNLATTTDFYCTDSTNTLYKRPFNSLINLTEGFSVSLTLPQNTPNLSDKIIFDDVNTTQGRFNISSWYDPGTGTATITHDGYHHFDVTVSFEVNLNIVNQYITVTLNRNGSPECRGRSFYSAAMNDPVTIQLSGNIHVAGGDEFEVFISGPAGTQRVVNEYPNTFFSMYQIAL